MFTIFLIQFGHRSEPLPSLDLAVSTARVLGIECRIDQAGKPVATVCPKCGLSFIEIEDELERSRR